MQAPAKILFRYSIIFIGSILLISALWWLIPIESTNNDINGACYSIIFFGLPIAILLTMSGTIKQSDPAGINGIKIILTFAAVGLSIFFMIMMAFANMCGWTNRAILFEKKSNPSVKIISRGYGCGAPDSGAPTYENFKIYQLPLGFIWAVKIDTNKIVKNGWVRIGKN